MALLVTILLMMINFSIETGRRIPSRSHFNAMDMWMLGEK